MSDPLHLRLVEALLFASAKPIDEEGLAARLPEGVPVAEVLAELVTIYAERGVNLVRRGDGWAFRTAPDLGAILGKETILPRKIPRAAAETLAIVAYHQPVTRAEIEEIRGVSVSQGTLDLLFEAGWVRPQGRKEAPGRPMLWGTTETFLDHFGLKSLDDLPGLDELRASGLLDPNPGLAVYAATAGEDAVSADAAIEALGEDEPVSAVAESAEEGVSESDSPSESVMDLADEPDDSEDGARIEEEPEIEPADAFDEDSEGQAGPAPAES